MQLCRCLSTPHPLGTTRASVIPCTDCSAVHRTVLHVICRLPACNHTNQQKRTKRKHRVYASQDSLHPEIVKAAWQSRQTCLRQLYPGPACTGGGNLVTSRCKQAASEGSQKLPCTSHGCTEQCSPEVTACLELITFQDLLP